MTQSQFYIILWPVLLTAVLADLLVPFIISRKYHGYSHLRMTISSLGTVKSPVRKYQCINLIIVGFFLLGFAVGEFFILPLKDWAVWLYFLGIIFFGIGCILAGFFPADPKTDEESLTSKVHGIASGIGFLFLILNPLWALWIQVFQVFFIINIIFFIFGLSSFVLFVISEKKEEGLFQYTGLFQRLNLLVLYNVLILNHFQLSFFLFN